MERTRPALLAAAIAAALTLSACGDGRDDRVATPTDGSVASSNAPSSTSEAYRNDRVTADASSAAARADNAGDRAAARVDQAGDRAAALASDAALTARVKAALMAEPGIDSLQLDVDTQGGRVTLSGEADSPEQRQRALQVARGVDGVAGVVDRMSVKR